jgi:hypothetical protein
VLAEHPRGGSFDAFWMIGGRIADWGPLTGADDVLRRTEAALRAGDGTGAVGYLRPDDIVESRIVTTWVASHETPALDLAGGADELALRRFLRGAGVAVGAAG